MPNRQFSHRMLLEGSDLQYGLINDEQSIYAVENKEKIMC